MFRIFFREMYACVTTPAFYAVSGVFLCLAGLFFFHEAASVSILASRIAQSGVSGGIGMNELLLRPFFLDLSTLVIFLIPLAVMGIFQGERGPAPDPERPVGAAGLVAGKYLAALTACALMIAPSALLMAVLTYFTAPDWGVVVSSYLGTALLGGAVISMGAFASGLARHPGSAAALTLCLALMFWSAGWFSPLFPEGRAGSVLQELSLQWHLSRFFGGTVSLKDMAFYLELMVFFLVLALTFPGKRRQRG